ncbi:MAG TPA: MBL fold metallo-hydrolase [Smithellaceae bacterium]|nr:MBL fold metallo-hydrolase [Smithellaceae bacterium]HRS83600.1 MBL fold metallo-hydrolase [Smithellaceae bacterium]HRV45528.1 MBL fold metallo-hydrolase [Smithellaceae bacterium]
MKKQAKGQIHERITAIPNAWYPVYLVLGEKKNLLIDAGVNLLGPRYLALIREILGGAGRLDCLFLTHSHYDHIGAAAYLKRHIPGLKIGAHERLASLMQKPSVLDIMNRLSANHVELLKYNTTGEDLTLKPFDLDILLKQGDELDLGGLTCRVYETPGHTKDSLTFYFPEIQALFPGESAGVLQGQTAGEMQVEFLSSYQDYIDSLGQMIKLKPSLICLGHGWVLSGRDAEDFLQRSLAETYRYRRLIETYLASADGDAQRATEEMARTEYDVKGGILQERNSYMTNLSAQVKHVAGLCGS